MVVPGLWKNLSIDSSSFFMIFVYFYYYVVEYNSSLSITSIAEIFNDFFVGITYTKFLFLCKNNDNRPIQKVIPSKTKKITPCSVSNLNAEAGRNIAMIYANIAKIINTIE